MRFSIRRLGYTLIEVLGVVLVLGMIALVAVSALTQRRLRAADPAGVSPAPESRHVELPPGWQLWEIESFSDNRLWVEATSENDQSIRAILFFNGQGWCEVWRVTPPDLGELP